MPALTRYEYHFIHSAGAKRRVVVHATSVETAEQMAWLAVGGWRKFWMVDDVVCNDGREASA